ncbi:MAG: 4a-hydroxytetrahydrobiopterin dehydratase [Gammaproteobacteria bacterium]|nr:4a-hydroxytetrahydrobiopterin dehydratase [Gammaproteobacteria bacterium]
MEQLITCDCEACRIGAPLATDAEREQYMAQLPDWSIVTIDGVDRLMRRYTFSNFAEALAFTNKVGELAEAQGHHPALLTEWGSVEVSWWSHKIKGLHKNDFIVAAKTDGLYSEA